MKPGAFKIWDTMDALYKEVVTGKLDTTCTDPPRGAVDGGGVGLGDRRGGGGQHDLARFGGRLLVIIFVGIPVRVFRVGVGGDRFEGPHCEHARVVALQVAFERQTLKPVFHLIGYRLWV